MTVWKQSSTGDNMRHNTHIAHDES